MGKKGEKQISRQLRLALGVCFLIATMTSDTRSKVWARYDFFTEYYEELGYTGKWTNTMDHAARYNGAKLQDQGTVLNKKRVKKWKLSTITPDEAKLASFILKTGYTEYTPMVGGGRTKEVHHYYTSLDDALERSLQLSAIKKKFNLTNDQLWTAMHKADPNLRRRRVHIMRGLDDDAKQKRITKAKLFLTRVRTNTDFLDRIYFIDECAICFDHETRKGVHVYCDAFDKGYRMVIPYIKAKPNQKIKVHILVAVNAITGATFLEFTSGTTDIKRRFNNDPGSATQRRYKVGVWPHSAHASFCT
jgi:hypothetical protein